MEAAPILQQESQDFQEEASIGRILRAAREAHGLSPEEVAVSLHLRKSIIYSLESDDYDIGVPKAFVRGYIKNYARLVNAEPSHISQHMHESLLEDEDHMLSPGIINKEDDPQKFSIKKVTFYVGVALAIAIIGYLIS